ncbi:hypothetical protein [Vogesella oryzae]|uniref:hypothetical protein n=1 Tax=Vogesella oryzae TaxID=1735285 RepID=UPI0015835A52|nr:hypothetical protein [Vogesella oryzae]
MRILLIALSLLFSVVAGAQDMTIPKTECENLMNAALPFAVQMLQKHGEFFPYGAALKTNGEIASVAGYDGREQPPSNDIIHMLKEGFVKGATSGEYRATALVYDVRVALPSTGTKSDAIAVSLNHRDNYSVNVFFPYQLTNGQLSFGTAFEQEGDADVFSSK